MNSARQSKALYEHGRYVQYLYESGRIRLYSERLAPSPRDTPHAPYATYDFSSDLCQPHRTFSVEQITYRGYLAVAPIFVGRTPRLVAEHAPWSALDDLVTG